jgi:hypothetical protein
MKMGIMIGQNPTVSTEGDKVILTLSAKKVDIASLVDRLSEILPLFDASLRAKEALSALDDAGREARLIGIVAQQMTFQAGRLRAIEAASLLVDNTADKENIADHGFPEFAAGMLRDV